jgi:hypothetical protein
MAGSPDNLSACHLIGSMFAGVLYTVYVLAFGASIHFLLNVRRQRVKPNKIILVVSVVIFVCVTVVHPGASVPDLYLRMPQQWGIHNAYVYAAFVAHGDKANGALALFNGNSMFQIAQLYVYSVNVALLDGVLVR